MTESPDRPAAPIVTVAETPGPSPAALATGTRSRAAPAGRRWGRIAVQSFAFVGGVFLLWWCARQALAEENRAQLERLAEASAWEVLLVSGLSVVSITINGLVFWAAIRPVRRLSPVAMVATNAVASFMNYLPFKASLVARVLIHTRRDGVPFLTIGAWFAAMGIVLLSVYGPLVGVSLWRRAIDGVWVAAGLGGIGLMLTVVVLFGRAFRGEKGLSRLEWLARLTMTRLGGNLAARVLRTRLFARVHAGADMLACPKAVGIEAALWLSDLGVQTTRFVIVASMLGLSLTWQDALLVASCYFLIGVASPAGQLGTREAGTTWLAATLGLAGGADLAVVMLVASAVESLVNLMMAGAGVVYLRPDRWLWGRASLEAGAAAKAGPSPAVRLESVEGTTSAQMSLDEPSRPIR